MKQKDSDMLVVGITKKDISLIKKILASNQLSKEHKTEALMIAATHDNSLPVLELLIKAQNDNTGKILQQALIAAINSQNLDNTRYLLKQARYLPVRTIDAAISTDNVDLVKVVLNDKKIKVSNENLLQAYNNKQYQILELLLIRANPKLFSDPVTKKMRTFLKQRREEPDCELVVELDLVDKELVKNEINLVDTICTNDPEVLHEVLTTGQYTIDEVIDDEIILCAASTGSEEVLQVITEYIDPNDQCLEASQVSSETLDAAVLSKNKALLEYIFNGYTDGDNKGISIDQLDNRTLLTAAISGPEYIRVLLEWRDQDGRGVTVNDILNSGLLNVLVKRNDRQSLNYVMNEYIDHTGVCIEDNLGVLWVQAQVPDTEQVVISPPSFEVLVKKTREETSEQRQKALIKNLSNIISKHGDELAEAISDNILASTKTVKARLDSGKIPILTPAPLQQSQSAPKYVPKNRPNKPLLIPELRPVTTRRIAQRPQKVQRAPSPRYTQQQLDNAIKTAAKQAAQTAYKSQTEILEQMFQKQHLASLANTASTKIVSNIKEFVKQVDPKRVAKVIVNNPELLKKASLEARDIGKLLTEYASVKEDNLSQIAKFAGSVMTQQSDQRTVYRGNMESSFEEQIRMSATDLGSYSNEQLSILAKAMEIDCKDKTRDLLCHEIARKIVYSHSSSIPETSSSMCANYDKVIDKAQLKKIRDTIYKEFFEYKDAVTEMSADDLYRLFQRYDQLCFNGDIQQYIKGVGYTLKFKTNGEPTFTTEGVCIHKTCDYVVTIPVDYFRNVGKVTNVAGQSCKDQLECLQRVIEHEMVHLVIFMFCGDSYITTQHGGLFMKLAKNLFEHTDHRHYIF